MARRSRSGSSSIRTARWPRGLGCKVPTVFKAVLAGSIPYLGTEPPSENLDGVLPQFSARCPILLQTRHPRPETVKREKGFPDGSY